MTIHNECHNQSRFFRVTHTCCSITFLFYLPWQPSQCHNLPVILKIISRNFQKFAKFPKNFTIIKSSKNYQKQSITRPSVDSAKDWLDQSFPFLAWSGVVLYGLVKADCLCQACTLISWHLAVFCRVVAFSVSDSRCWQLMAHSVGPC